MENLIKAKYIFEVFDKDIQYELDKNKTEVRIISVDNYPEKDVTVYHCSYRNKLYDYEKQRVGVDFNEL